MGDVDFGGWLEGTVKLGQHLGVLEQLGYDDLEFLSELDEHELADMKKSLKEAGVPPGHVARFAKRVAALSGGGTGTGTGMSLASTTGSAGGSTRGLDATQRLDSTQGSLMGDDDDATAQFAPSAAVGDVGARTFFCVPCRTEVATPEHCGVATLDLSRGALVRPAPGLFVRRRFRIVEALARGGMGEVWRATDTVSSREVALKTVRVDMGQGKELHAALCRFRREAMIGAMVEHAGLVRVHDYGQDDSGLIFLVMDLASGPDLAALIKQRGPLTADDMCTVVAAALEATHSLHRMRVLHRDIKPSNLMLTGLTEGGAIEAANVRVIDYGIAKRLGHADDDDDEEDDEDSAGATTLSQDGAPASLPYTAPERLQDDSKTTLHADLFSFGITAFELVTGHRPFRGKVAELMLQLMQAEPPVEELEAAATPRVAEVVLRALAKEPRERWESAEAFAAALRAAAPAEIVRQQAAAEEEARRQAEASATAKELERARAELEAIRASEAERAAAALEEAERRMAAQQVDLSSAVADSSRDIGSMLQMLESDVEVRAAIMRHAGTDRLFDAVSGLPGAVTRESGHPYQNNEDHCETLSISGARALGIVFTDDTCTEPHHDFLRFFAGNQAAGTPVGRERFAGRSDWPGQANNAPVVVPGDTLTYTWHSDGSNTEHGYKFAVYPTVYVDPLAALLAEPGAVMLESAHPYENNTDTSQEVSIPGARFLKITFDPSSSTERGCDYVSFHDPQSPNSFFGEEKYSGGRNNSASNFGEPVHVPGDRVIVKFHTDGSNVDLGWRLAVTADNDYVEPWVAHAQQHPDVVLVESEHPYPNNYDFCERVPIATPAAPAAVGILFHPRSATEPSNDNINFYAVDPRSNPTARPLNARPVSGRGNFPHKLGSSDGPLVVRPTGDELWVRFQSDHSSNDWGFALYAFPCADPYADWEGHEFARVIESAHPYDNSVDQTFPVTIRGAQSLHICFGAESSTELNYDFVRFEDEAGNRVGDEKYSGGRSGSAPHFPRPSDPLVVRGETVRIRWITDNSNTDWGWRCIIKPGPETSAADLRRLQEEARAAVVQNPVGMGYAALREQPGAREYESAHPYDNNTDVFTHINMPDAEAIGICFHPDTETERHHDYVRFTDGDPRQNSGAPRLGDRDRYSGASGQWPGHQGVPPAVLRANDVHMQWHTDGSNVAWGFKLVAFPTVWVDPLAAFLAKPGAAVVESPHPYADNMDTHETVHIPGARYIKVLFDATSATEGNCDYVRLYKDTSYSTFWGQDKYHGGRGGSSSNFPTVANGQPPIVIEGDSFIVHFHSDHSNVDWGFKLVAWPDNDHVDPWVAFKGEHPNGAELESPHPYENNYVSYQRIPNVVRSNGRVPAIVFHPDSRTEGGCDYLCIYDGDPRRGGSDSEPPRDDARKLVGPVSGRPDFPHSLGKNNGEPIVLRGDDLWLYFRTDGSNVDWGWRAYVYEVDDPLAGWSQGEFSQMLQSDHPYDNSTNATFRVFCPGARQLLVAFDEESKTEAGYDYVQFWDMHESTRYGLEKYSGGRGGSNKNFPTTESPLVIDADRFLVRWVTDNSNVDWGWRMFVKPSDDSDAGTMRQAKAQFEQEGGHLTQFERHQSEGQIFESAHPYENNTDQEWTISLGSGNAIGIVFDDESVTEQSHDHVTFWSADGNVQYGDGRYSGGHHHWPGQGDREPLVLPCTQALVRWHTDGSNVARGWRFVAYPTQWVDPMQEFLDRPSATVLESAHPYADNTEQHTSLSMPGARAIRVVFDPRTSTERTHDFVRFYKDDSHEAYFGEEKYSGGRGGSDSNFPTTHEDSVVIRGDRCVVYWRTDQSNTDWGFRLVAYRDDDYQDPWDTLLASTPGAVVQETAHPYSNNEDVTFELSVGGGQCMHVVFHEDSRCEASCDWLQFYRDAECTQPLCDKLSGRPRFPHTLGKAPPLFLPLERVYGKWHTDGSNVDWGWRLMACSAPDPLNGFSRIVESAHPYENNTDVSWTVRCDGASAVELAFDPASLTEPGYDYVTIHMPDGQQHGEEKYHGGRGNTSSNWASASPSSPLRVPGDTAVVRFRTDNSNVAFGWRLGARGV